MMKITLTQVKERATGLAQSGIAKSTQVAEMTKLQLNIVSQEEMIKKSFYELGKRYYEQYGKAPEPAYEASCLKVAEGYKQINQYKERIKELRNPDVFSIYDDSDLVDLRDDEIFVVRPEALEEDEDLGDNDFSDFV